MKKIRILFITLAAILVVAMITIMITTNMTKKDKASGLDEYESGNLEDLPDNLVDESLDVESGIDVGHHAPDFELKTLTGEVVKLSDYRGKTVMLNFWASWCPPCRVEMPHMETYYQEYKDQDNIEILAVNMTTLERGSQEKVPEFVDKHGLTFPILMDEKGEIMDLYKVMVYPTTYIVNPDGVITDKVMIPLDVEVIKWLIENSDEFSVE
ncbi:peroxiredoxin [Sporosarcina pasteurii]|uniref:Thiol-disulfide oxidoreductase resA n=1 Tax=Sporosarcina pasteurii TaxID=1474 RepID=A0A380CDJ1_SPOPA|nr:TlpA disulfide reductase family protein [Sporosarcina pasteurii]MDS9473119.1 TlpA disulfide reductase family protein [Sporosarcina pasteurii]QBQ04232.1 TlpA family protein disulfide reductase [Sporosarcina pasteurii]SUJ17247.1 Thiol-disulfide oxidoreductase resA [Sporosarcina pasteurii]